MNVIDRYIEIEIGYYRDSINESYIGHMVLIRFMCTSKVIV